MVYSFGVKDNTKEIQSRELLGNKGKNLSEMHTLGMPIPPGFTIPTTACRTFLEQRQLNADLKKDVKKALQQMESTLGLEFGSATKPLLVSVRSGAVASMPGMMDTILNLGLSDEAVAYLARTCPEFAYDSYRRFIYMYSTIVLGISESKFSPLKGKASSLELIQAYKEVLSQAGLSIPSDPYEQLWGAISAVFLSWMSDRALAYRKIYGIDGSVGTAVTVQSMVFGNMDNLSATGVVFSRDPVMGTSELYGEFMINAQGEDIVSGSHTPYPISKKQAAKVGGKHTQKSMEEMMPQAYEELVKILSQLEQHYRDMQDVEFTVEQGKLWILQSRAGKRTPLAGINIAVNMVQEGLLSQDEALGIIDANSVGQLLHPQLGEYDENLVLCQGLAASPGAASGKVSLSVATTDMDSILIRNETSSEDIIGMQSAAGILTARGGTTSHAAVIARSMGKPCITGADAIHIDEEVGMVNINGHALMEGDRITIDGNSGKIILGEIAKQEGKTPPAFQTVLAWADKARDMKVYANCDTAAEAEAACSFGAEGIGLCRTEHMFFSHHKLASMRKVILSDDPVTYAQALEEIAQFQQEDFTSILRMMGAKPVNVRLLDPPLHEFLPKEEHAIKELADELHMSEEQLVAKVEALGEANPMLGHRGCRLGITRPDIYMTQAEALLRAAYDVEGSQINIMIPFIMDVRELANIKRNLNERVKKMGTKVRYRFGTMIEIPRAALLAEQIAQQVDFISFGTNDLTQMTLGISRDDSDKFLKNYLEMGILERDPFLKLDQEGVGALIKMATEKARKVAKTESRHISISICGEHGGDPDSIGFCQEVGMDYISCSAFRIPQAKLAAAQAAIRTKR
jgi:pyruvate,orthophosphate dikinase